MRVQPGDSPDPAAALPFVEVPTLVVSIDDDRTVRPSACAAVLKQLRASNGSRLSRLLSFRAGGHFGLLEGVDAGGEAGVEHPGGSRPPAVAAEASRRFAEGLVRFFDECGLTCASSPRSSAASDRPEGRRG